MKGTEAAYKNLEEGSEGAKLATWARKVRKVLRVSSWAAHKFSNCISTCQQMIFLQLEQQKER